jgi:beta-carotene hydroxylase
MRHHAFTNDPTRDPDYYLCGSALEIPGKLLKTSIGQLVIAVLGWRRGFVPAMPELEKQRLAIVDDLPNEEFVTQRRYAAIQLALMVAFSFAGYFVEVMLLYYLPSRIGIGLAMFLFAWFPHHPARERGRYRDTRVMLFPMSGLLFRGHDRHIIHHMLPRVPHYRIPAVFAELRPSLEQQGIRVEGRSAGPGHPPVLMRADG